jgi:hypothetical protein
MSNAFLRTGWGDRTLLARDRGIMNSLWLFLITCLPPHCCLAVSQATLKRKLSPSAGQLKTHP